MHGSGSESRPQKADVAPVLTLTDETPAPLSCARPYTDPVTLRAAQPEIPAAAQQMMITGTVRVLVTIDERGTPIFARTVQTTSRLLNHAAESAAMRSRFAAGTFRCRSIAGVYLFTVSYSA